MILLSADAPCFGKDFYMKILQRIYSGEKFCQGSKCCPVVDLIRRGVVEIHDPKRPERGRFVMSTEEYNALIKNAKSVE